MAMACGSLGLAVNPVLLRLRLARRPRTFELKRHRHTDELASARHQGLWQPSVFKFASSEMR